MRGFVSSVRAGFEEMRETAVEAVKTLDHEVIRFEDFAASPISPQIACLSGVRQADFVVVVLGQRYGHKQSSGLSATHEEFKEAKEIAKPTFVFVQSGVTPEPDQRAFIEEAQGWAGGNFTAQFSTPAELRNAITRAVHRWQLSEASGGVNVNEMAARAAAQFEHAHRQHGTWGNPLLCVSVVGAPEQQILRPTQLEAVQFRRELKKRAVYGSSAIFDEAQGVEDEISNHDLIVAQRDHSIRLGANGSIFLTLPPRADDHFGTIIEEELGELLERSLTFCLDLLQHLDPNERLSALAVAVNFARAQHICLMTRRELAAAGNTRQIKSFEGDYRDPVMLNPPVRSRGALRSERAEIVRDLAVMLRRKVR